MSNLPRLRPGENQGDLLCNITEPLALVGQTGPDHGAAAAELARLEARRAEFDRLQLPVFDLSMNDVDAAGNCYSDADPGL